MTSSGTRREIASLEEVPEVSLSLAVPSDWRTESGGGTIALAALQPGETAGPFADNVVVTIERLADGAPTELALVHGAMRLWLNSTVQDLHVLDERPHPAAEREGMFMAFLQTTEQLASVVTRQWCTVVGDVVVSMALTTFPFRDAEAEELFEDLLASCVLGPQKEEGR